MPIFLEYFNLGAAFFIIVCMVLMLGRLLGGPTLYDRLLAVNSFGTKTIIFLCIFCFIIDRPDGLDIALLYALMNFIATIAVLKFFNYRCLGVSFNKRTDGGRRMIISTLSTVILDSNIGWAGLVQSQPIVPYNS